MLLKQQGFLALMDSVNADESRSNSVGTSHFNSIACANQSWRWFQLSWEQELTLRRTQLRRLPFTSIHSTPAQDTSARAEVMFVDRRIESSNGFFEFLNTSIHCMGTISNLVLKNFQLEASAQLSVKKKRSLKARSKGRHLDIMQKVLNLLTDSVSAQSKPLMIKHTTNLSSRATVEA